MNAEAWKRLQESGTQLGKPEPSARIAARLALKGCCGWVRATMRRTIALAVTALGALTCGAG